MRRAAFILALGLFACEAPPRSKLPTGLNDRAAGTKKQRTGPVRLTDDDLARIATQVGVARQLGSDRTVLISRLPRDKFIEQFRATSGPGDAAAEARQAAFLAGFDFAPRPSQARGVSKTEDVVEEQLLGFYDVKADKVFVPDVTAETPQKLLQSSGVVAHEVEHALQAQRFGKLRPPTSSDQEIAELALIEGDAQAAMAAYIGHEAGAPVGRTLRRVVEATKEVPIAAVAHGDDSKALDRALARTRARLEFPYVDGMLFVSDLYRAGGFEAVDAAFKDPPTSSEQILHPEKYLAGEEPRPIAAIAAPAGTEVALTNTLGELDTRILFERCVDKPAAAIASRGWAGDRFTILATHDHRLMTAWVSAWDTESDAQELEDTLRHSDGCWGDNATAAGGNEFTIGKEHGVERRGSVVVFLRGVPAAMQSALTTQLFASVGAPVPLKARSAATLPPRVPLPEPEVGRLRADVYENPWLGVVGRIPPGMTGELGKEEPTLFIKRSGVMVFGGLAISTRVASDEQNERTFGEVQDEFGRQVSRAGLELESQGGGAVTTVLGKGVERTWLLAGTSGGIRLVLVPICAGTGSIVFFQAYGDLYARKVLEDWMGSFEFTNGRNLKACDYLDPK